ncbi:hypothetical protein SAMN05216333_11537 [Nitrosomonas oligotropha]|uniref:Uncharacterized protein n=1 Tax=Nitrosomonas oligotropha TaxID=42354 RepID=A0A1H8RQ66_9PROT|nr:hypothetical protein SAMN05216300_11637 [Nitrosomonas oligotropha]SEO68496.1 hypothetical protein SAMN05216333_11537 [Nitrosomonas oligotropha]
MAVINVQAEQREISAYLTRIGVNQCDHETLLRKMRTDPAGYQRYLDSARKAQRKS